MGHINRFWGLSCDIFRGCHVPDHRRVALGACQASKWEAVGAQWLVHGGGGGGVLTGLRWQKPSRDSEVIL